MSTSRFKCQTNFATVGFAFQALANIAGENHWPTSLAIVAGPNLVA
jgi:hypothetical protein